MLPPAFLDQFRYQGLEVEFLVPESTLYGGGRGFHAGEPPAR